MVATTVVVTRVYHLKRVVAGIHSEFLVFDRDSHRQSKLSPTQLDELQRATHFDKKELQQWYKGVWGDRGNRAIGLTTPCLRVPQGLPVGYPH